MSARTQGFQVTSMCSEAQPEASHLRLRDVYQGAMLESLCRASHSGIKGNIEKGDVYEGSGSIALLGTRIEQTTRLRLLQLIPESAYEAR